MTEPMIPLSVIDAAISEVEEYEEGTKWSEYEVVSLLSDLKKEAIPVQGQPLEPLSSNCEWESQVNVDNWIQNGITKCPYCGNPLRNKKPLEPLSCPFCNWGETDNEINLARHFEKEHQYKASLMLARILLR